MSAVANETIGRLPIASRVAYKPAAELRQASLLLKTGRPDDAMAVYDSILAKEPGNVAALSARGRIALRQKDFDALHQLLPAFVVHVPQVALLACKLLGRNGRLAQVVPHLPALARSTAGNEAVHAYVKRVAAKLTTMGRQAKVAGDVGDAVRLLRSALVLDPAGKKAGTVLASLFAVRIRAANEAKRRGDVAGAVAPLVSVLADDPDNVACTRWLALLLLRAGRADYALPHLERYVELVPGDVDMLRRLVLAHEKVGPLEQAIAPLKGLCDAGKDDPNIARFVAARATRLARALSKQGDYGAAARSTLLALELQPENPAATNVLKFVRARLFGKVRSAIRARQFDGTLELGQVAISVDPHNVALATMVAKFMIGRKDFAAAEVIFEQLRAQGTRSYDVEAGLARVRFARHDYSGALEAAVQALNLRSDDVAMSRIIDRLKAVLLRAA